MKKCETCKGTRRGICTLCGGGKTIVVGDKPKQVEVTCTRCAGTGRDPETICPACKGEKGSVSVRSIKPADYAAVRELLKSSDKFHHDLQPDRFLPGEPGERVVYPDAYFDQVTKDKNAILVVAVIEEQIVGFIWVSYRERDIPAFVHPNCVHIQDVVVNQAYRKHGLGTALMNYAKAWGKKKGVMTVELDVHEGNSAKLLYQKLGFVDVATRMVLKIEEE